MSESRLNLGVGIIGDDSPKRPFVKPVTQKDAIAWIKSQKFDPYMETALLKKLMSYPVGTYHKFRENLDVYMEQIQRNNIQSENVDQKTDSEFE